MALVRTNVMLSDRSHRCSKAFPILAGLTGIFLSAPGQAAPLDTPQALELITSTADRICNVVSTKGEAQSSEVKGDVKVQLSGLASKLANAGVSGAGSINNEEYQNVVRKDLTQTLHDNAACKLKVFETLQARLLASNATPSPPVIPNADSGWVGGGSSPKAFCDPQLAAIQAKHPNFNIAMTILPEGHNAEYSLTGGKHDVYRYTCSFAATPK
jgi:hypothetical protein